jgi:Helix-turn-helix domain
MKISIIFKLHEHLVSGKGITPMEALKKWGCFRLSARINELRNAGTPIITETIKKNGKSFANYFISR